MAEEQQQQQQLISPFPAPPPFYEHFTKQNRNRLRQLHKEDSSEDDVPPELRYLIPPQPPSTSKFAVFGQEIDLEAPAPTLEESGIEQLYPDHPSVTTNPQPHLLALARSLLTTFLSLTGILSANPELYEERVMDIQAIVFNMHSLINQYRPHQARESLIMLMEERAEKMRAEVRGIEEGRERVAKLLEGMKAMEGAESDIVAVNGFGSKTVDGADTVADKKRRTMQRNKWQMLDVEMG